MSQVTNTAWDSLNQALSKSVEFLIVIAGWPTVYSVANSSYALQDMTSGLNDKLSQFSSVQQLASVPSGTGSKCKGRPEEGSTTISQVDVEILDKRLANVRVGTDLASRQSYLEGSSAGHACSLVAGANINLQYQYLLPADTILTLSDNFFNEGDVVYVGKEAIKLGDKGAPNSLGFVLYGVFRPCVRGYRLTDSALHVGQDSVNNIAGAKVYGFMPSLYRRKLVIYKGFQSMTNTANFVRAFTGVISDDAKSGASLGITAMGMTWDLFAGDKKMIGDIVSDAGNDAYQLGVAAPVPYLVAPLHPADTTVAIIFGKMGMVVNGQPQSFTNADPPSLISAGHYAIEVAGEILGIESLVSKDPYYQYGPAGSIVTLWQFKVKRGVGGSPKADETPSNGYEQCRLAFSNMDFSQTTAQGTEPITLILQLLISQFGYGANGQGTYDVFPVGVGLGINPSVINIASFTAIQALPDYDSDQRVFFVWDEPAPALQWIEDNLCKPFGLYLFTGNDGRINLARSRCPTSLRIAYPNDKLYVNGVVATLATGSYRPSEMCTQILVALNALGIAGAAWTCAFTNNKFTIGSALAFSLTATTGTRNAAATLGFTTNRSAGVSYLADAQVATNSANVLTQNDVWQVEEASARGYQITSVTYKVGYNWGIKGYTNELYWIDAESVNLGDALGEQNYGVECEGLISGNAGAGLHGLGMGTWWLSVLGQGCDLSPSHAPSNSGVDKPDGWATLFSLMLLDRYKSPPMMIKARLPWRWSTLELGDVVFLSHSTQALVIDREKNSDLVVGRNFEVVDLKPSFGAYVEATLLGFREYP